MKGFPQARRNPAIRVTSMAEDKKCMQCGSASAKKWIERENLVGMKAYFCSPKCFQDYKKKGEESGVCEFC